MTPKEKKAFVKKMREAKEAKAKERKKKPKISKRAKRVQQITKRMINPSTHKPMSELPQRISLERKWEKEAKNSKKIEYEKITKIKL